MKKIVVLLSTLVAFVGLNVASAADMPATDAATANTQVAVVNLQQVLKTSPKVTAMNKAMEEQFKPQQEKLTALQKSVQKEMADLKKNEAVMSASDKKKQQEKIASDRESFLKQATKFQRDLNAAQEKSMKEVFAQLNTVIGDVAKKDHYTLVLDSQAVAFANDKVDITKEVSTAFNKTTTTATTPTTAKDKSKA